MGITRLFGVSTDLRACGSATRQSSANSLCPDPPAIKASPTVRRWMRNMTARDEVAQLVFIAFHGESPNTRSREYRKFVRLIHETKVGGLVLNNVSNGRTIQKAQPYQVAAFLNKMQRLASVPLMVGGDFERGASMRLEGTTVFPHAMAFGAAGDPALTRYEGEVTAREARAVGVQWLYYPVADVNNNPDNPIINIRSFGENPNDVAAHVRAFIEGAHADKKNYTLATAKHFPGHGDTAVDTHMNLATIPADHRAPRACGTGSVQGCDRRRSGRDHDGAHRGARARAAGSSGDSLAGHPHGSAAEATGVQGHRRDRRAGDGQASPKASARERPACWRSKPARTRC